MTLQEHLNAGANTIIENWITTVGENFPNIFDLRMLKKNGIVYFKILKDTHIPAEQHPFFHIIPTIAKYHVNIGTPIEYLLHSLHIFRECLDEYIFDEMLENVSLKEGKKYILYLHQRIDTAKRYFCQIYVENATTTIQRQDKEIDKLHSDRLNTLGKMAASMAHEIKNPLFAIEGFLKLIREEVKDQNVSTKNIERYLDVVDKEFEGLYGQITSFLSFSKNNSTSEPIINCPVNILMQSVINLSTPRLIDENITIESILGDCYISVQKGAIQQVLSNLVNNSIEALSEVSYPKTLRVESGEDEHNCYIHIADNGPGVPEEIRKKVFDPFITAKKHGTGLGLSICKQIMEKNNGDLTFTSKKGETIFTLTFKKCNMLTENVEQLSSYI